MVESSRSAAHCFHGLLVVTRNHGLSTANNLLSAANGRDCIAPRCSAGLPDGVIASGLCSASAT